MAFPKIYQEQEVLMRSRTLESKVKMQILQHTQDFNSAPMLIRKMLFRLSYDLRSICEAYKGKLLEMVNVFIGRNVQLRNVFYTDAKKHSITGLCCKASKVLKGRIFGK